LEPKQAYKLIQKCIDGNRKSQSELYQYIYKKLFVVCLRYTSDVNEANEIFQESAIKIFVKLETYNKTGVFEAWCRRIIVNTALDYIRKRKNIFNTISETKITDTPDEDESTGFEIENIDLSAEQLLHLIQKLSPVYKTVFNLYVFENYSHKQISEALHISIGTSKSNLAKARISLQKMLTNELIKIEKHETYPY